MTVRYLSLGEIAEYVGLRASTIKSYYHKGMLPPPDGQVGRNRGWLPSTVDDWMANRPHASKRAGS